MEIKADSERATKTMIQLLYVLNIVWLICLIFDSEWWLAFCIFSLFFHTIQILMDIFEEKIDNKKILSNNKVLNKLNKMAQK